MRAVAATQRMACDQREFVAILVVDQRCIAAAHVILDIGIVVVGAVFLDAEPRAQCQRPVLPIQPEVQDHPIPRARQRVGAPVGHVIEADAAHAALPTEDAVVVAKDQHRFGLVIGLAERARRIGVVGLPARALGVAHPDIAVVAEQVFHHLGLEAELELELGAVQLLRRIDRVGRIRRLRGAVGVASPERRQQVHRLVTAQLESAQLGVLGQFPASVQQRAAAGIGHGFFFRLVLAVGAEEIADPADRARIVGLGLLLLGQLRCGIGLCGLLRRVAQRLVVTGQTSGIGSHRGAGLRRGRLRCDFLRMCQRRGGQCDQHQGAGGVLGHGQSGRNEGARQAQRCAV
ncbi:hypothetical protein XAUC_16730 [Xanthomonas citri pv. aurantifolii str. ICPB 10535]|nr:hypothetical protein XAUC_16730 [Xanthomonas citri pv. aurantifolii str. ICPB 10535]